MVDSWEKRAAAKRRRVLASIPRQFIHEEIAFSLEETASVLNVPQQYLSDRELGITGLDPVELIAGLADRRFSAVEVLNAFVHRAAIAHALTHCCLDIPYAQALATAQALDASYESTGRISGPLHGLPVSVKDQCRLVGSETTCGFVHPLGSDDVEDAVIVKLLKESGAVVYAKTSLSMGCMWGETVNNILGRSSNPFNRSFSCGGSSGGEGALLSMRGSVLGVGSDLAGSIRSPSCYGGLYGLRPSNGRLPYYGMRNSMEGQLTVKSVCGPMSTTIDGVELFMRSVIGNKPWLYDPSCQPVPWNQSLVDDTSISQKLCIGMFEFDGVCLPQPPIRNALKEVAAVLTEAGHHVLAFRIDTQRTLDLLLQVFQSDASGDLARQCALSGEPVLENAGQTSNPPITILESWDLAMRCEDFRADVLRQWNATVAVCDGKAMDAYISPIVPAVAPRHGDYTKVRYFAYTAVANVLDLPACTLPVRFVNPKVDLPDDPSLVKDAKGNDLPAVTCERDEIIRRKYTPEAYHGLPIGLQVVGRRMEEEKVVGIVKMISRLLRS